MQERIFRFSIAGLTFLLSICLGFWFLGGDIKPLINSNSETILTALLGVILSPALGFLISSLNIHFWEEIWPKRKVFRESSQEVEQKYLEMMYKKFPYYSGIILKNDKYIINDNEALLLNHQTLLRSTNNNKEVIDFSTRRMDIYYAQINGFYSILIGLLAGACLNFYLCQGMKRYFNITKLFFLVPVAIYLIVAFKQAIKAQKQSNRFEKIFLLQ